MIRIEASLLIPGDGEPVDDGVVVAGDGVISYAGPAAAAPPTPRAEVTAAAVVMPGLWDCHGHFMGTRSLDLNRLPQEPTALRAARSARDLVNALSAGVTSVREVGGLGVHLARAVSEGTLDGPAIYAAGAILSTTGGHGDLHCYPLSWVTDFAAKDGTLRLADGEADCMRAAREQLRAGARLIKVCASGGVLSELDSPIHQQFTAAELRAIVEVAGMADRVVAAHCHGKPGIMAAIEAGVATIEHGTYLDAEACDAMAETGTILVPTRSIIEEILTHLADVPPYAAAKLTALAQTHADAVAAGHRTRRHDRDGHRYQRDRDGPAELLGPQRSGTRPSGQPRDDSAAGNPRRDRGGAAHGRPAGGQGRAAGSRIRRGPDHARRQPARRHLGTRPARSRDRSLDSGAAGEGLIGRMRNGVPGRARCLGEGLRLTVWRQARTGLPKGGSDDAPAQRSALGRAAADDGAGADRTDRGRHCWRCAVPRRPHGRAVAARGCARSRSGS